VANVTGRKDAGDAGFYPIRIALQLPSYRPLSVAYQVGSSKNESALVPLYDA
jgi:hypothetical protein